MQEKFLGVRDINKADAVYQTNQAARAMQIGGLTGSGSHEFMYIAVMESDMIFIDGQLLWICYGIFCDSVEYDFAS